MPEASKDAIVFVTKSPSEMDVAARHVLSLGPHVILLQGVLGTGKTALVKVLCHLLGSPDEVTSPTFTLVNEYRDAREQPIYHIDLYRLKSLEDALQIGIEDYLLSGAWCFVEWPELILHMLDGAFVQVILEALPDGSRRIRILK
ncbi:MAG TPA: tRNA (adenosine(37)-N6)-threonylcarbamoyltransferase complex ATPase subunit type 1 TsaE [Saprospiraceae bacterium]|nr:tRNA (adenosine(37)-N6)-threonylcarbamoyltransferase complex ATPase subunit type 1 TsaE [Saprospiraceae bacterium]